MSSFAVVFHGRVGVWHATASSIVRGGNHALLEANAEVAGRREWRTMSTARKEALEAAGVDLPGQQDSTIAGFIRFAHGSFIEHVVQPSRAAGIKLHVFLHSWHPELASLLDSLFKPVTSAHDALPPELKRYGSSVRSQHTSMHRALRLMTAQQGELSFTHVLVTRYDVLWLAPFSLALPHSTEAPPSPLLWLPHWCHRARLVSADDATVLRAACGFRNVYQGDAFLAKRPECADWNCFPLARTPLNTALVLDWWFVATTGIASAFAEIGQRHDEYMKQMRLPRLYRWSHFFWSHVVNSVLRIANRTRHVLHEGRDFTLARNWLRGASCHQRIPDGTLLWAHYGAPKVTVSSSAIGDVARRLGASSKQCPAVTEHSHAGGARVICPWYSPACGKAHGIRMLALEATVKALMNQTTSLRAPALIGKPRFRRWCQGCG
jgi:hypothetical protein